MPRGAEGTCSAAIPYATFAFTMRDTALRLLVGADDGTGSLYGFAEAVFSPGEKVCQMYFSEKAQVVFLKPAETLTPAAAARA